MKLDASATQPTVSVEDLFGALSQAEEIAHEHATPTRSADTERGSAEATSVRPHDEHLARWPVDPEPEYHTDPIPNPSSFFDGSEVNAGPEQPQRDSREGP